jgi:hypothetical protein
MVLEKLGLTAPLFFQWGIVNLDPGYVLGGIDELP